MKTIPAVVSRIKELFAHYGLNANKATAKLEYSSSSKLYKILQGSEPSFSTLVDLLRTFPDLSADWLMLGIGTMLRSVAGDASGAALSVALRPAASLWAIGSDKVLAATDDNEGKGSTLLVPVRAQVGYTRAYNDAKRLQELHPYYLPGFEHGTYRVFEVSGDGMEPTINHHDVVVCSCVERWDLLEPGEMYVVVTPENVLLKRIPTRIVNRGDLVELRSDNHTIEPYQLPAADILELWAVRGYISTYLPSASIYREG